MAAEADGNSGRQPAGSDLQVCYPILKSMATFKFGDRREGEFGARHARHQCRHRPSFSSARRRRFFD